MNPATFSFHEFLDFLRVAKEIIIHEFQVIIELEHVWNGCREIQMNDLFIGDVF